VLVELSVVEQRYAAVLEVVRDGLSVVEVAERYAVSRQTVYTWVRRYEAGGLGALGDRSHRPVSCPHQLAASVEATICELRRLHPDWGQRRIAHELGRRGGRVPSLSAIYRTFARNGLLIPGARRRKRSDYIRWERRRPMELWQMDVMGGIRLLDGTELKVLTGIDDHSRFCVSAGLMASANARAVCRVFAAALARHGVPDEILTDNGKVFTGRFSKPPVEVLFERICRENGITHRLTAVRSPTTTGKIERFHRTLRLELLADESFADLDTAQVAFDAWVDDYNTNRPHQALGMATPVERFGPPPGPAPSVVTEPAPGPPPTTVTRHVTKSGNISVTGQTFNVGKRYAGRTVTVDVGRTVLRIYFDGALVRSKPRTNDKPIVQYEAHTRFRTQVG
jgi:transposase InsO family protein